MAALARDYPDAEGRMLRALNQAARELLLAQSSDWAFLMSMGTAVPYAQRRFREHTLRFTTLHDQVRAGGIDEKYLSDLEWRDSIFQELDYRVYA